MTLGRDRGVIAMSDANTVVAPDWVVTTLAEFALGVDAVPLVGFSSIRLDL